MSGSHLDKATDPLLDALLALLAEHANGTLGAQLGGDVVVGRYNHPAPLPIASQLKLPAISLVRGSPITHAEVGGERIVERVPFVLEYVAPATPLDLLNDRWPLLNAALVAFREALLVGDSSHYTGTDLEDLGVRAIDARDIRAELRFGEAGSYAYPSLRLQFTAEVVVVDFAEPGVPLSGLLFDLVHQPAEGLEHVIVSGLADTTNPTPAPSSELDGEWYGEAAE